MISSVRCATLALVALIATACISPPAPKYQPSIDNVELLNRQTAKITVGKFTADRGVENHSLSIRGSQLKGGQDGTFSTYLHDAVVAELQASARYDEHSPLVLSGVLTRNELSTGMGKGSASVGGEFVLARDSQTCYRKTLLAHHEWDSSFFGAVAIPAAIDNYPTTVQMLLNELFSDPDFVSALRTGSPSP
jgi:hypothetical protein